MIYEYKYINRNAGAICCFVSVMVLAYTLLKVLPQHDTTAGAIGFSLLLSMPFFLVGVSVERFRKVYLAPIEMGDKWIKGNVTDGTYRFLRPKRNIVKIGAKDIIEINEVTSYNDPRFTRLDEKGGLEIKSQAGIMYVYRFLPGYSDLKSKLYKLLEDNQSAVSEH